jgi:hypothetical protein
MLEHGTEHRLQDKPCLKTRLFCFFKAPLAEFAAYYHRYRYKFKTGIRALFFGWLTEDQVFGTIFLIIFPTFCQLLCISFKGT